MTWRWDASRPTFDSTFFFLDLRSGEAWRLNNLPPTFDQTAYTLDSDGIGSPILTGPPEGPTISEGAYRRKRKPKFIRLPKPIFIAPASFERASPQAVIDKVPDFTAITQTLGENAAALSARIDAEIEHLMREAAERDDEEALVWILRALDD